MQIIGATDTRAHDDVICIPDHCQLGSFISFLHLIHLLSFSSTDKLSGELLSIYSEMCLLRDSVATVRGRSRIASGLDCSPIRLRGVASAKARYRDPRNPVPQPVTLWIP